ncbi:MAG: DUF5663 domain-containing protein [Candidatus Moranbacteria bacterium]|nr:DUF5663 domain-containing protein [Candidatus Moranbacteria bacterium]
MENKKNNNSPSIENFVSQLVKDKGLDNLEPEVLQQVKSDLAERVEDRLNAAMVAKMPPEKLEFFEKMLDKSSQEEVRSFCERNIPGLDGIVAAELIEFRKTYLNL